MYERNFTDRKRDGIPCVIIPWVAEMLQKPKFLLRVLYSCYMKFYFFYIFHIYDIWFIIYSLHIYMYIICFLILLYISALFDLRFVWRFYFYYMYKIVINCHIVKKLYFNDSNFFLYEHFYYIWFSHSIRLVKSSRQFVFKILYYIIRL